MLISTPIFGFKKFEEQFLRFRLKVFDISSFISPDILLSIYPGNAPKILSAIFLEINYVNFSFFRDSFRDFSWRFLMGLLGIFFRGFRQGFLSEIRGSFRDSPLISHEFILCISSCMFPKCLQRFTPGFLSRVFPAFQSLYSIPSLLFSCFSISSLSRILHILNGIFPRLPQGFHQDSSCVFTWGFFNRDSSPNSFRIYFEYSSQKS